MIPDELVGKNLRTNYSKLLKDPHRPLYNRAVSSHYPRDRPSSWYRG